jgi:hypothetical protein
LHGLKQSIGFLVDCDLSASFDSCAEGEKIWETGYIHCEKIKIFALISKHVRLQGFYFIVIKEYQTCCI